MKYGKVGVVFTITDKDNWDLVVNSLEEEKKQWYKFFIDSLKSKGYDVRVVTYSNEVKDFYGLEDAEVNKELNKGVIGAARIKSFTGSYLSNLEVDLNVYTVRKVVDKSWDWIVFLTDRAMFFPIDLIEKMIENAYWGSYYHLVLNNAGKGMDIEVFSSHVFDLLDMLLDNEPDKVARSYFNSWNNILLKRFPKMQIKFVMEPWTANPYYWRKNYNLAFFTAKPFKEPFLLPVLAHQEPEKFMRIFYYPHTLYVENISESVEFLKDALNNSYENFPLKVLVDLREDFKWENLKEIYENYHIWNRALIFNIEQINDEFMEFISDFVDVVILEIFEVNFEKLKDFIGKWQKKLLEKDRGRRRIYIYSTKDVIKKLDEKNFFNPEVGPLLKEKESKLNTIAEFCHWISSKAYITREGFKFCPFGNSKVFDNFNNFWLEKQNFIFDRVSKFEAVSCFINEKTCTYWWRKFAK